MASEWICKFQQYSYWKEKVLNAVAATPVYFIYLIFITHWYCKFQQLSYWKDKVLSIVASSPVYFIYLIFITYWYLGYSVLKGNCTLHQEKTNIGNWINDIKSNKYN